MAVPAVQGHHQPLQVDLAVGAARYKTDDGGVHGFQQRARRFQSSGGVVVARNDDGVQVRHTRLGLLQKAVELLLRGSRRVGGVKHIARHQQRVDLLGHQGVQQPVQKTLVLKAPLKAMQGLAQVPVRGVDEAQGSGPVGMEICYGIRSKTGNQTVGRKVFWINFAASDTIAGPW